MSRDTVKRACKLVTRERTTTQPRNNKCVMINMSCVMTVTKLAWHPREPSRAADIVDDRVEKECALQPRLEPVRVHEGGAHGLVQENIWSTKMPQANSIEDRHKTNYLDQKISFFILNLFVVASRVFFRNPIVQFFSVKKTLVGDRSVGTEQQTTQRLWCVSWI